MIFDELNHVEISLKGSDLLLVLVVQGGGESRAGRRSHHATCVLLPLRLFGGGDLGEGTVAARLPQAQPPRRRRLVLALVLHLGRHLGSRLLSSLRREEEEWLVRKLIYRRLWEEVEFFGFFSNRKTLIFVSN